MRNKILMVLLLPLLIAGCQGKKDSAASEQTEITFWHIWQEGHESEPHIIALIDKFQEENPNITVNHLGTSFWDYWAKVGTAIAGGKGPDIFIHTIDNVAFRSEEGVTENLKPWIDADNYDLSPFYPEHIDFARYKDGIWAMPLSASVRVLLYNKDMLAEAGFDRPPRDWNELEAYAEALKIEGDGGIMERVGFDPQLGNYPLLMAAWTNGATFFDGETPTMDTPETREALDFMIRMHELNNGDIGISGIGDPEAISGTLVNDAMLQGKLAMTITTASAYNTIMNKNPSFELGVAPAPYPVERANWSSGFSLEIAALKDENQRKAAWEFMKFIMRKDNQIFWNQNIGWLTGNKDAMTDPAVSGSGEYRRITDEIPYARNKVFIFGSHAWHIHLDAKAKPAIQGILDAEQALAETQELIEADIENYNLTH